MSPSEMAGLAPGREEQRSQNEEQSQDLAEAVLLIQYHSDPFSERRESPVVTNRSMNRMNGDAERIVCRGNYVQNRKRLGAERDLSYWP